MNASKPRQNLCLLILSAITLAFGAGCVHTEDDNLSERPWNTPKNWESGIPQSMQQGR